MTDTDDLNDYLILRALDDPITRDDLDDAAAASGEALSALREEGVGIRWIDSEVLTDEDGRVTGTFCHYRAEDEAAVHEHGERAGLPVTRVDRRGQPLDGE
ncbi:nickel-binding protein [Salinirubellus sp. GCM10025818]|uniref:nickel-binding protein n=1 Tax=Salinirubellus TaxID=2162630 RepID=UPI0030CC9B13